MAELDHDDAGLSFDLSEEHDGTPLVTVEGELDMITAPELDSAVGPILARQPSRLVIDASRLEFADSSAIALLVTWANRVPEIEIRQPPELLRRVIARMGLSDRLQVRP
ncbi:MAG TPA: STAS domain-containing protein [Solirubrobacteraceae bacterium]|nr:STAS domain-containing protein [Solirubrobacteraceae bacterium]